MTGAALGIVVAVIIGYGIYRGGVKINMAKFFRFTGIVLVLVAAGLLATAAHTAHEAGWLNTFQDQAVNLRWLVDPGSVRAALLTGMFGLQAQPVWAEVLRLARLRGAVPRHRHRPQARLGPQHVVRSYDTGHGGEMSPMRQFRKTGSSIVAAGAALDAHIERVRLVLQAERLGDRHRRAHGRVQAHRRGLRPRPPRAARGRDHVPASRTTAPTRSPRWSCCRAAASSASPRTSRPACPARSASRCSPAPTRRSARTARARRRATSS